MQIGDQVAPDETAKRAAAMKRQPASVAVLQPRYLSEDGASRYSGRSRSWLRNQRSRDAALIEKGLDPEGPRWVTLGRSVLYEVTALDVWLDANTKPMAVGEPRRASKVKQ